MEDNIISLVSEFNASSDLQKNRLYMGLHKNRYIYMFAILSITLYVLYIQGSVPEGYTGS